MNVNEVQGLDYSGSQTGIPLSKKTSTAQYGQYKVERTPAFLKAMKQATDVDISKEPTPEEVFKSKVRQITALQTKAELLYRQADRSSPQELPVQAQAELTRINRDYRALIEGLTVSHPTKVNELLKTLQPELEPDTFLSDSDMLEAMDQS